MSTIPCQPFSSPPLDVNSHFGVIDMAGFEKDSAAYYRAQWLPSGQSYISLAPRDWNSPVPVGSTVTLRAFTGAPFAEAFVNGVSLGRQAISPYQIASWPNVKFAPGNISAVAYGADGSTVVATSVVATTGAAAALLVTPVAIGTAPLAADGADVALFTGQVVDAAGALVPDACPPLTFAVTAGPGSIIGLANGDPADHTPDKVGMPDLPYGGVWKRSAWMGLARAIVQTQAGKPGAITLTVSSPGLTTGTATVSSQ